MHKNRQYFIHIRQANAMGAPAEKGGATVAWKMDDDGNLIIGKPVFVKFDESYVRRIGRDESMKKFNGFAPLATLTKEDLADAAIFNVRKLLEMQNMINQGFANNAITDKMTVENVFDVMTTSWFESIVRAVLVNSGSIDARKYLI